MRRLINSLAAAFVALFLLLPASALAFDPLNPCDDSSAPTNCQDACGGAAANSPACQESTTNPISGANGIIRRVARVIVIITGIVSVIMIIVGSIKYITSSGEPKAVDSAKNTILYALIGIAITISAQAIIVFVINRL